MSSTGEHSHHHRTHLAIRQNCQHFFGNNQRWKVNFSNQFKLFQPRPFGRLSTTPRRKSGAGSQPGGRPRWSDVSLWSSRGSREPGGGLDILFALHLGSQQCQRQSQGQHSDYQVGERIENWFQVKVFQLIFSSSNRQTPDPGEVTIEKEEQSWGGATPGFIFVLSFNDFGIFWIFCLTSDICAILQISVAYIFTSK